MIVKRNYCYKKQQTYFLVYTAWKPTLPCPPSLRMELSEGESCLMLLRHESVMMMVFPGVSKQKNRGLYTI